MAHCQGHVCQCLSRILTLRRESPVTIAGNRRRTGVKFVEGVLSLARGLSESGLRRGEVVAIAAFNSEWYMEWLLAIAYVGGIAAPLNYRWSFQEARSAMELVRPVILVVDERCSSWAFELQKKNLPSLRLHVFIGETVPSLGHTGSFVTTNSIRRPSQDTPTLDPVWAPKGVALICFTSGTTGRPKGVAISHTALIVQSLAKIAIVGYGEDDVYLHTAPLCHIGGISSCMAMLMAGGCHVLIPKFDAKSAIQAIEQHLVTSLITVPAMMADLVSYVRKGKKWNGGETVNKILNGGGGLSVELISGATHIFPHAKLVSAYGMTETCSSLTFMTLWDSTSQKHGKLLPNNYTVKSDLLCHHHGGVHVGKPAPHVELQIRGSCSNSGIPSIGRILTRGSHVMVGYWEQTMAVMLDSVQHGWLDTGDIGWLDSNGDLWLIGREKDRIKCGGENVYPEEVEVVLCQHPGVSNVVVIGVPDIRLTEKLAACVTIKEDWEWVDQPSSHSEEVKELSSEVLRNYCRQKNLTGFKIPKIYLLWTKPFPFTTTGKLQREDLRKEVVSYLNVLQSNL